jgi:hypothetical protein
MDSFLDSFAASPKKSGLRPHTSMDMKQLSFTDDPSRLARTSLASSRRSSRARDSHRSPPKHLTSSIIKCELDAKTRAGRLQQLVAGQAVTVGVDVRFGLGMTEKDPHLLMEFMGRNGGLQSFFVSHGDEVFEELPCRLIAGTTFGVELTAPQPGRYALHILLAGTPIDDSPLLVVVHAGLPSPRHSIATGSGVCCGQAGAQLGFSVTFRDEFENPSEGGLEEVGMWMEGPGRVEITVLQEAASVLVGYYTAMATGDYRLHVALGREEIAGSPYFVQIMPGPCAPDRTVIEAEFNGRDLVVGETYSFDVQLNDANGNPLAQCDDVVEGVMEGLTQSVVDVKPSGRGRFAVFFMSRRSGHGELFVDVNRTRVNPIEAVRVHFHPQVPHFVNTECTLATRRHTAVVCKAGVPASFMIFARDRYGNRCKNIAAADNEFRPSARVKGTGVDAFLKVTHEGDGSFTVPFVLNVAGDYLVHVTIGNFEVLNSPFLLQVDCHDAFPPECDVEIDDASRDIPAGVEGYFRVLAFDRFHNRVQTGGEKITGELIATEDEALTYPVKVTDVGGGVYEGVFSANIVGAYRLVLRCRAMPIAKTGTFLIRVVPTVASHVHTAVRADELGQGVAGEENFFSIDVRDKFGNFLTEGFCPLDCVIIADADSTRFRGRVEDVGNGRYNCSFTLPTSGTFFVALRIAGRHIVHSPFPYLNLPAALCPRRCIIVSKLASRCSAGAPYKFTIQGRDVFDNHVIVGGAKFITQIEGQTNMRGTLEDVGNGQYVVKYSTFWAGQYQLKCIHVDGTEVIGSPFGFDTVPGPLDHKNCFISSDAVASNNALGMETRITVQTKDKYDNNLVEEVELDCSVDGPEPITPTLSYDGDGFYILSFSATRSGQYHVSIVHQNRHIKGSPYGLFMTPGVINASSCVASGPSLTSMVAGKAGKFIIEARDLYSNPVGKGGDRFDVLVTGEGKATIEKFADLRDGRYEVQFSINKSGLYSLDVRYRGEPILDSPWDCSVSPSETFAPNCFCTGFGVKAAWMGRESSFVIHSVDVFGNHRDVGGDLWKVVMTGPEFIRTTIDDLSNGTYKVTYTTTVRGIFRIIVSLDGKQTRDSPFDILSDVSKGAGKVQLGEGGGAEEEGEDGEEGDEDDEDEEDGEDEEEGGG